MPKSDRTHIGFDKWFQSFYFCNERVSRCSNGADIARSVDDFSFEIFDEEFRAQVAMRKHKRLFCFDHEFFHTTVGCIILYWFRLHLVDIIWLYSVVKNCPDPRMVEVWCHFQLQFLQHGQLLEKGVRHETSKFWNVWIFTAWFRTAFPSASRIDIIRWLPDFAAPITITAFSLLVMFRIFESRLTPGLSGRFAKYAAPYSTNFFSARSCRVTFFLSICNRIFDFSW